MYNEIDFGKGSHGDGYSQVNTYWMHEHYKGIAYKFLKDIDCNEKKNYFNHDDAIPTIFIDHIILISILVNGVNHTL